MENNQQEYNNVNKKINFNDINFLVKLALCVSCLSVLLTSFNFGLTLNNKNENNYCKKEYSCVRKNNNFNDGKFSCRGRKGNCINKFQCDNWKENSNKNYKKSFPNKYKNSNNNNLREKQKFSKNEDFNQFNNDKNYKE